MPQEIIERLLWYDGPSGREVLRQAELSAHASPLVILGEAGMGKSSLLDWLAAFPGHAHCTARQLINRHDPRTLLRDASVLVIDALDEVSASREGDAVDLVLRQLGRLAYPRFVLSCRVADWRSATGAAAIAEQYGNAPLELHLQPFDEDDVRKYLDSKLGRDAADVVIEHFNGRRLGEMLGNPQTLELIVRIARVGQLPETGTELFERAVHVLRVEHRDAKSDHQDASFIGMDSAGAACAALILTGSEAIVRTAEPNVSEGELPLCAIGALADVQAVGKILGTRLFRADGADRFTYAHRRIGEFLGAAWLSEHVDTARKRNRLLALFHGHGLVPASLRGIHAWLARDPSLTHAVIAADPMGLIEYGDTDTLNPEQARSLFSALKRLANENPYFARRGYSVKGLAQASTIEDIRLLLKEQDAPVGLQLLAIEALRQSPLASNVSNELHSIVLDPSAAFACREAAVEAIAYLDRGKSTPLFARALYDLGDSDSLRLGIELLSEGGYASVDDALLVDLVIAHADEGNVVGVLFGLQRTLPFSRIESVLDKLAVALNAAAESGKAQEFALADFAYHLIGRRVGAGGIAAERVWAWLAPFDASAGYDRGTRDDLAELFHDDSALRQAIQKLVLLDRTSASTIRSRAFALQDRSQGLSLQEGDILQLLKSLEPTDLCDFRWKELVELGLHGSDTGLEIREAAMPFAANRPELSEWLDNLAAAPVPSEWQTKRAERERVRSAERSAARDKRREFYSQRIASVQSGDAGLLGPAAKVYLNLLGYEEADEQTPPRARISQWVGEDIAGAIEVGLEAFLVRRPIEEDAAAVAESVARSGCLLSALVVVTALSERLRRGASFEDLPSEHLFIGFFALQSPILFRLSSLEQAIENTLKQRGIWKAAMTRFYESCIANKQEYASSLQKLMRNSSEATLAVELAVDWLDRFSDIPAHLEEELIDRLLRSECSRELRRFYRTRTGRVDGKRRLIWEAVGLIVDFDAAVSRLNDPVERELIFHLRNRTEGLSHAGIGVALDPRQIEWIVQTFRSIWPITGFPHISISGRGNSWDASSYVTHMIRLLGNDLSEQASVSLGRLLCTSDGYLDTIRMAAVEQAQKRVEITYRPPTLGTIAAIIHDRLPSDAADLQAYVLDELAVVQAKVRSDDADSWRGFYDDAGLPFEEERCRDHLLGLLRQGTGGISYAPETHVGADREVDVTCTVGLMRLPIEIKGQWHTELWRGADSQLDKLYTRDWQASDHGIYLVLWFGDQPASKRLRGPGGGRETPTTPHQLRQMLETSTLATKEGRVSIFVLDVARP